MSYRATRPFICNWFHWNRFSHLWENRVRLGERYTHTCRKCSARRTESSGIRHSALLSTFIPLVCAVIAISSRRKAKSEMIEMTFNFNFNPEQGRKHWNSTILNLNDVEATYFDRSYSFKQSTGYVSFYNFQTTCLNIMKFTV